MSQRCIENMRAGDAVVFHYMFEYRTDDITTTLLYRNKYYRWITDDGYIIPGYKKVITSIIKKAK